MADAPVIGIADAMVTAINAASFSQPFSCSRTYLPSLDRASLASVSIFVVPIVEDEELLTRAKNLCDCDLEIGVFRGVDTTKLNVEVDALINLVIEIRDFLRDQRPAGASFIKVLNRPLYDPKDLRELNQFTSIITATYRTTR